MLAASEAGEERASIATSPGTVTVSETLFARLATLGYNVNKSWRAHSSAVRAPGS